MTHCRNRCSRSIFQTINNPKYSHSAYQQTAFSLLEIIIVVLLLSVSAAITLPNLSSNNPYQLDNAAQELAEAIRFARAEAIRSNETRGIWYFSSTSKLSLYRLVSVLSIPTPTYDIYHPVDKKLYSVDFSENGHLNPIQLTSVTLQYGGDTTNREYISFDSHGTPRYLSGSTYQMLDNASIVLSYGGQTRTITVSPMIGRVVVQ